MKLLLIQPRAPESFWSFRWVFDSIVTTRRAVNPPLGLATVAALTPSDWEVVIVDENVESVPLETNADVVGIGGMGVHYQRQVELLRWFRAKGSHVVAGGSYASLCPEKYDAIADTVIAGEAEYIWPEFCRDFEAGVSRPLYREGGTVALADSPAPRFDLLRLERYNMASLQFSRGCPFQCEFCDIVVMFGRSPRVKPVRQIIAELDALRLRGVRDVFFVDDNFIGNRRAAKELLAALIDYQREHGVEFRFGTEASLNMAHDPELLDQLRAANFHWVFIGIESSDEASLRETGKLQNVREDMLTSLRRIYRHGIDVFAGFIVGFDHDTTETFERQYQFIMQSGVQMAMIGLLTAVPRTPLHARLKREGRLLGEAAEDNTRLSTNVLPKSMSYAEMIEGYRSLFQRLFSNRGIADRIRTKMRHYRPYGRTNGFTPIQQVAIFWRLLMRGVRPGGPGAWWHFLRTAVTVRPRKLGVVMAEWITGLSMRNYAEQYFFASKSELAGERVVDRMRRRLRKYVGKGALQIGIESARQAVPRLSIQFAAPDARMLRKAGRQLRRFLRRTGGEVTIHLERIAPRDAVAFQRLQKKLRRYGDRISISIAETLQGLVEIDGSRFRYLMPVPTSQRR